MKQDRYPIRLTTKGKAIAGIAAVALGGGVAKSFEDNNAAIINKDRITALDTASSVLGRVVVLKAGANYRLSPDVEDTAEGNPNNLGGSVPQGKELVVKLPLVSSPPNLYTADQTGWIGFTMPGTDTSSIHNKNDRAKNTVWADLSALEAQQLAVELPYGNLKEGSQISADLPATVGDDGGIDITGDIEVVQPSTNAYVNSSNQVVPTGYDTSTIDKIAVSAFERAGGYEQLQADGIPTTK